MEATPYEYYDKDIPKLSLTHGVLLNRYQDVRYGVIKLHAFTHYELMFVVSGLVSVATEEKKYPVRPGSLVICPPNVMHATQIPNSTKDYHRYVLNVSPEVYEKALDRFGLKNAHVPYKTSEVFVYQFDPTEIANIQGHLNCIYNHITLNDRYSASGILNGLSEILLLVERDSCKTKKQGAHSSSSMALLAREMIFSEFRDSMLSLESIANRLYINKSYLSRVFRESYNQTVYQTVIDCRLVYAVDRLHNGSSVKQAYLESGFKDYSAFLKSFKKKYDVLPTEYVSNHVRS